MCIQPTTTITSITKAQIYKLDKRSSTYKPTSNKICLLQVDATTRLVVTTKGILDVMRQQVSIICPIIMLLY